MNSSYDQQEEINTLGCIEQQSLFGLSEWSFMFECLRESCSQWHFVFQQLPNPLETSNLLVLQSLLGRLLVDWV